MLLMVLLVGALIVADILLFVALGPVNTVPWLLLIVTLAIPFFVRRREAKQFV